MKLYGWDTETFLWQDGEASPRLVCGSHYDGTTFGLGTASETLDFFESALTAGDHLTGVNIAFDIVVCAAMRPRLLPLIFKAGNAGQFHDVAIREGLNDIFKGEMIDKGNEDENGKRYSLEVLMQRHYNLDISPEKHGDVWRYRYAELDGKPISAYPEAATRYMRNDAQRPRDIHLKQKADGFQNLHDEANQVRAAIAIQLMRTWGFRTDADYIATLERDVDALWESSRAEFAKAGIFEAQPDGTWKKSTKRLQELVSAAYDGEPPKTAGGGVATDRDTLEESGDPVLVKLASSGKNDKRKTTYIPALKRGVSVPLITEFDVLKITGRVSSDFQQMPQKGGIREAVRARPGTVLCSLDYGGLELRTMSQRAIYEVGFSKMAEFINSGRDPHIHVAAYFLGITYEAALTRYKAGEPLLKAYRGLAKIFNFGKGGGMGAGAMAYNARVKDGVRFCLSLNRAKVCGTQKVDAWVQGKKKRICAACVQVAKELGDKWLNAWPEQKALARKAGQLTAGKRKAQAVTFGSKRIRGGCTYTQWLNTPFQGAGGDGCKRAMWLIAQEAYTDPKSPLWGSRVLLNVHDELLLEIPWEQRHAAAYRAAEIMRVTMDLVTPDVRNEVKPAIMRRLFKAADECFDSKGVLRPWWPKDWAYAPDAEIMRADLAA